MSFWFTLPAQEITATVFGLLGEGVLPPANLAQSVASLEQALDGREGPTAVVARSQSKGDAGAPPRWLPDDFVAQVWCNRAMLTGFDLEDGAFRDLTLLELLPALLRARYTGIRPSWPVLVDGTHLVPSVFGSERASGNLILPSRGAEANGRRLFGRLKLALVRGNEDDGDGSGDAFIGKAPWPPAYVLEHVAMEAGIVLVNSVNCGYLDMAINFLMAARKVVNDVKVPTTNVCCSDVWVRRRVLFPQFVSEFEIRSWSRRQKGCRIHLTFCAFRLK